MAVKIKRLSKKTETSNIKKHREDYPDIISPKNFEAILRSITDGIIILKPTGNILFANKSFKELIKIPNSPEGKHFIEVIRNIDLLNLLRSVVKNREEIVGELTIRKEGKDFFILAKAMPVLGKEGEIKFLIVLLQDITKMKKLENFRRDLVANVSHELKTPVTAIKGYAETLLDGAIDDKENAKKFVEIIKKHVDRLSTLINDLLTLSRIESGDIVIAKESIVINSLVESVFPLFSERAEKKMIKIDKEIPEGATVNADRDKIMQILINLLDNAVKFTETGFVIVEFYSNNGDFILSVQDTGIGIPREHLPRIGERFYRVDTARSRELGGTGLGLAIVKHLVMAHGWNLKIESEVGKGTEVKIIIPSKDVKAI
jgi:two-component system phosphate regulon sensor histidine kinase PhoR